MKKDQFPRKKTHSSANEHWIFGRHAALAALVNPRRSINRIMLNRNMHHEITQEHRVAEKFSDIIQLVENKALENLLPVGSVHQGIAIQAAPLPEITIEEFCRSLSAKKSVVLVLDQITDPHNVGAILRSAAAFGVDAIITTMHNSPQESGTLAKSASGTLELVPLIRVTNLVSAMELLKEHHYWILGLDGHASITLNAVTAYDRTVLILGSEEKGMRRLTREYCDVLVKLPISDAVESLNVSNAAAISLYALSIGKNKDA
jgi:23S rRNA (guanosine2251-2'-O)-methyltransferase